MKTIALIALLIITSCQRRPPSTREVVQHAATHQVAQADGMVEKEIPPINHSSKEIATGTTTPQQVIKYAKSLIGTPYLYGSTDPQKGFDCSGFITYVFNHFNIAVPRSSIDFTDVERKVPLDSAKPGDLVLFTGTNFSAPEVGHMGIIVTGGPTKEFIHSTSGKAYGVTITPLSDYYMKRFVKIIRIFPANNKE